MKLIFTVLALALLALSACGLTSGRSPMCDTNPRCFDAVMGTKQF